ncbi:hypothetical protein FPV67DRAFT_1151719 [Lyophyllum atratum]|nr:hypothetical protein FPV67DRAFT_1151719 [Lyophyllum atratum]
MRLVVVYSTVEIDLNSRAETSAVVLAAYALNTGIIASIFSLICIALYPAMPDNLFFASKIVLTGLYVNSFLAMLNARFYFQRSDGFVNVTLPHGSVIMYDHAAQQATRAPRQMQQESTNNATINEVGLPLFKPRHGSGELPSSGIQLMEVKVTKEELQTQDC